MEVLQELSREFEIIVFTASHECYANAILDQLDPGKTIINHRIFRQHCISYVNDKFDTSAPDNTHLMKDFRIFANRSPDNMIIVDNSPFAFCTTFENGIAIPPYYDDKSDDEMIHLLHYIRSLNAHPDVRPPLIKSFQLELYKQTNNVDLLIAQMLRNQK